MSDRSPKPDDDRERVAVVVEELISGRRIEHPIHDDRGVVLLAAGAVVTPELKRQLRSHGVEEIRLTRSDAKRTTTARRTDAETPVPDSLPETERTRRLDAIVEQETPRIRGGQTLRIGRASRLHDYDDQMRKHLEDQHDAVCRDVADAMRAALADEAVEGEKLSRIAGSYLKHLVNDSDLVLAASYGAINADALADHAVKTSQLSMALAIELGWGEQDVRDAGTIALVQDWGLGRVPPGILDAPRALNRHETFELMKHPIYSVDLLENASGLPQVTAIVAYQMHERIDGGGYPRGRGERTIHPYAKLIQIADAYVAMISPRPWRRPMMPYAALECVLRQAKAKHFDGGIVRALLHLLSLFPVGSFVTLSDGTLAQVRRRDGADYTRPLVRRLQSAEGRKFADRELYDLGAAGVTIATALPSPGRSERRYEKTAMSSFIQAPEADRNARVVHSPA